MYQQPRYDPQERGELFADARTMRPLVEGTVAQEMEIDPTIATGRTRDNTAWVLEIPPGVLERPNGPRRTLADLAARGRNRYDIYCAPCHALSGDAQAPSTGRGVMPPPNLHQERIRFMPDGQIYATLTYGLRNMPAYKHSVPLEDRWAIVAYVRALQLSQAGRAQAMNTTEQHRGQ
jgi:mono/diheme cytochrome c family protein